MEPEKVLLKASPMSGKTAVFTHLKTCMSHDFTFTLFRSSHLFKSDVYDCVVVKDQNSYFMTLPQFSRNGHEKSGSITSFIFLFFYLVIQFARWKVSPSFHTRTTSRKRRKKGIERQR